MEIHIPEPEEGYNFDKIKKKNSKIRWRILLFFVILVMIIASLILNDFSFDFSGHVVDQESAKTLDDVYGF